MRRHRIKKESLFPHLDNLIKVLLCNFFYYSPDLTPAELPNTLQIIHKRTHAEIFSRCYKKNIHTRTHYNNGNFYIFYALFYYTKVVKYALNLLSIRNHKYIFCYSSGLSRYLLVSGWIDTR